MMTAEQFSEAKLKLEFAFSPLTCKVEDWDYQTKIRFSVFDENNRSIIEVPKIVEGDVVDDSRLAIVIEQARAAIEARGES